MTDFPTRPTRCAAILRAVLLGLVLAAGSAAAALPAMIDGQALPSLAPMLEKVTPAVVNISSRTRVRVRDPFFDDPIFQRFFGIPDTPREQVEQSLGSGVIIDAVRGYILTNNHVVSGADDIAVTLTDGKTVKAKLIGTDADTDLAVLQIPADRLSALPLAESSKLRVGDFVVAVGDPFGLGQAVTSGIISALGRTGLGRSGYQNFIQTDASINPGNSGGALVNLRGELVGINSMIYSPSGGNVGVGFAIPSDLAEQVMQQLVKFGKVKRGVLGVQTQDVTPQLVKLLGLGDRGGAVITRVRAGSPAAKAGLVAGDVIVALGGRPVSNSQELHNLEGLSPTSAPVDLEILREGKSVKVSTTLQPPLLNTISGAALDPRLAGTGFTDLDSENAQGLNGVTATKVDPKSRAFVNGLREGDIVVAVNQRNIASGKDLARLVGQHPRQLMLTLVRGDSAYYLLLD